MTERTRLQIRSLTVAVAAAAFMAQTATAEPVFQGLGTLPGSGSFMSRANAVSADGTTVVGASQSVAGIEAFRWTFEGGMVGLGVLSGGDFYSEAYDVSANGAVIVGDGKSAIGAHREAFRWESGVMRGIGDLPGGNFFSMARSVSADGNAITGEAVSGRGAEAFRWDSQDGMLGLGDLPGGPFRSTGFAISDDGSTVVGSSTAGGPRDGEGFRWTATTGMLGLGELDGAPLTAIARAVSADGTIVFGSAEFPNAFQWTEKSGIIDIGPFTPLDASGDGAWVVGTTPLPEAVIWNAQDGVRSIEQLLQTTYGLDLLGWQLDRATGISDDGRVIVGTGVNPLGHGEGWIAVIPEPSSLSLLIGVFLAVVSKRRA